MARGATPGGEPGAKGEGAGGPLKENRNKGEKRKNRRKENEIKKEGSKKKERRKRKKNRIKTKRKLKEFLPRLCEKRKGH